MIHPGASSDLFSASLHRSFLIGCFISGTIALLIMPLYLAMMGAPHPAAILVMAWMLSQWPLALYLSRSGDLDRAIGISSILFACFVAAISFFTGGGESFAVFWLMIPPLETAFANKRRLTVGISLLCAGLFLIVSLLQPPFSYSSALSPDVKVISWFAALLYAGVIAYRISRDRQLARDAVLESDTRKRLISQSMSEVICEIGLDGGISILGGPVAELLGVPAPAKDEDWLFARLHVADRPLYLTRLSETRHNGTHSKFDVRLRVGRQGQTDQADYRNREVRLRPIGENIGSVPCANRVLLTIRDHDKNAPSQVGGLSSIDPDVSRVSWMLAGRAGESAEVSFSDIQSSMSRFDDPTGLSAAAIRHTAGEVKALCNAGLSSLEVIRELCPETERRSEHAASFSTVDLSINHCLELLMPIAERAGVALKVENDPEWPAMTTESETLRRSLCFLLTDMMQTAGYDAVVEIKGNREQSELQLVLSVNNRQSSLSWSTADSSTVLDFVNGLLEQAGGYLSVHNALGHGETVTIALPLRSRDLSRCEPIETAVKIQPLARTA